MTEMKMFNEAHEFTGRACEDMVNIKMLQEAARVCMVMKEYDEALDYLKLCGELEKDQNAETYSDIARCMYKLAELRSHAQESKEMQDQKIIDKELSRIAGMEMVQKSL